MPPWLPFRLTSRLPSWNWRRTVAISRGLPMRNSSSPPGAAASASSGIGSVSIVSLAPDESVQRLRTRREDVVELLEPGLGEVADLGVVDEDALHDARLQLRLLGA